MVQNLDEVRNKIPSPGFPLKSLRPCSTVSLPFGLDEKKTLADDHHIMLNSLAYLQLALEEEEEVFNR